MEKFISSFVSYIGKLLIYLADVIILVRKILMTVLFFGLLLTIVLGTLISFFEIFTNTDLFWGNFYYALIAFGIGITTIILGLVKMFKAGV